MMRDGRANFVAGRFIAAMAASVLSLLGGCSSGHQQQPTAPVGAASAAPVEKKSALVTPNSNSAFNPSATAKSRPVLSSGIGLKGYTVKPYFEKTIKQFEAVPATQPSKIGGTLFIGSSSFTKWRSLEKDMAEFNAINCGFGGSRTDDVLYYGQRIVEKFRPSRIVYYCGGNDIVSNRRAEVVVENFKSFVAMARAAFPDIPVYFISQNIVPTRFKFAAECDKANAQAAKWAAGQKGVYFIDAQPGLLDDQRHPIASLFVKDGVHLNSDGYKIWQANIIKGLETTGLAAEKIKTASTVHRNLPS